MKINIICAFSKNNGIGINNSMPWKLTSDLKKFKNLTIGNGNNAVIMGKNTWLSLPVKYLINRDNLILSKTIKIDATYNKNDVKTFIDINSILKYCHNKKYDIVWIIGGENIYREFMDNKYINIHEIYITYIDKEYTCDRFFPDIDIKQYENIFQKYHKQIDENNEYKIYDIIYRNKDYQ